MAALPIATVRVALGVPPRPAWQASLGGLVVGFVAVTVWHFPPGLALDAVAAGVVFALWPVMWIVFNALLLYDIAVVSGRFAAFHDWIVDHMPNDRRVVLVVIGFCFGCLLEGVSRFGTPVAITKMISPQTIATGVSVTFKHTVVPTPLLGCLVVAQQDLVPWMIPR